MKIKLKNIKGVAMRDLKIKLSALIIIVVLIATLGGCENYNNDIYYLTSLRCGDTLETKRLLHFDAELKQSNQNYEVYRVKCYWITVEPKTFVIKSIWRK
jgi:hypothetical protein